MRVEELEDMRQDMLAEQHDKECKECEKKKEAESKPKANSSNNESDILGFQSNSKPS